MMDVKDDLGPSSFKQFDRGYSTTNPARTMEPAVPHNINYELLIEIELALASHAKTDGERRSHLDQAEVYATLGEKHRDERALLVLPNRCSFGGDTLRRDHPNLAAMLYSAAIDAAMYPGDTPS